MIQNAINQYIAELNRLYHAGNATEHTYRFALQCLLENMTLGLTVTNEPKRIACGAPDYIVTRGEIPVGYIEAKDVGANLNDKAHKTQFDRYKQFAQWLSDEANEASRIKEDVPVMVVLGNPPYSGESQNSDEWMDRLMNDYKKEPSGIRLQEKNSKWINDDYVK